MPPVKPPVKPPARILMTACGAPGAPCILKCLRNNGERDVFVYGVDMNEDAVGFGMVDASGTCPPGRSEGFIDALLEIVRREDLQVVLPLSTMELDALAAAKGRFAAAGAWNLKNPPPMISTCTASRRSSRASHFPSSRGTARNRGKTVS